MRHRLVTAIMAGVLTVTAVGTAGCGHGTAAGAPPSGAASASAPAADAPAVAASPGAGPLSARETEVYVQVLRRYLGTGADNSFPGQTFKTVYVLDHAHPDAGDPMGKHHRGTSIAPAVQRHITTGLAGTAQVVFVADRETVLETKDGCPQVKAGGILITLGTLDGDDHEVQVAVNGFVACLGATWLTYVLRNQAGTGWQVTGTTGSAAIA